MQRKHLVAEPVFRLSTSYFMYVAYSYGDWTATWKDGLARASSKALYIYRPYSVGVKMITTINWNKVIINVNWRVFSIDQLRQEIR